VDDAEASEHRVLAIFDLLGELAAEPTFRGCAFVNASAEGPRAETKARKIGAESRAWLHALFVQLAREWGASDPAHLGRRLAMLYDGATVVASMERDPSAAREARAMAEVLLDADPRVASPKPRRRALAAAK
jgi:hypothetical protein